VAGVLEQAEVLADLAHRAAHETVPPLDPAPGIGCLLTVLDIT
jgi:hypothetical protein